MTTVNGNNLSPKTQQDALRRFVHRFTCEHRPEWAKQPRPDGSAYMPHFRDDADWLANTIFNVTKQGNLSNRTNYCHSSPTWPLGKHEAS